MPFVIMDLILLIANATFLTCLVCARSRFCRSCLGFFFRFAVGLRCSLIFFLRLLRTRLPDRLRVRAFRLRVVHPYTPHIRLPHCRFCGLFCTFAIFLTRLPL